MSELDKYSKGKESDKCGISLVELWKNDDSIRMNYKSNRERLSMEDILDTGIIIKSWELVKRESMKNPNENVEMIKFYYIIPDDKDGALHYTESQAGKIKDILKSVPNEVIEQHGGLKVMIQSQKAQGKFGKSYKFAGL